MNDARCGGHTVVVYQLPKLIARVRFPSPAFFLLFFGFLTGCATTEYKPLPEAPKSTATVTTLEHKPTPLKVEGYYHKVVKGQTLFRIAKAYGVAVEDIIKANNIPNAAAIEVDQLILIPGAKGAKEVAAPKAPDDNKDEFAWPIRGKVISYYNDRKGESSNRGIDIEANEGDAIKAAREGDVVLADYMAGYGQTLMLDHGDGFISVYAQADQLLVKLGDHVVKGDAIAHVGRVGKRSFCHFELRKGEMAVNPLYYLP